MKSIVKPILLGILSLCLGVSANTALSMDFIANFKADNFEVWQGDFDGDGKQDIYLKPKKYFMLIAVGSINVPLSFHSQSGYLWSDVLAGGQPHFIPWSAEASVAGAHKANYQAQLIDLNQDGRLDVLLSTGHAGLPDFVLYHGQKNQPLTGKVLVKGVNYLGTDTEAYPNYNYSLLNAHSAGELTPGAVAGASTVSELDGSFSYNMPISVPAGPSGITPSLSVAYSSVAGNGLMGVGFQLTGLSAISDCRVPYEKEEGAGVEADFQQQLCLDGTPLVERGSGSLYPENNPGLVVNPSAGGYLSESLTYERRHYGTSNNARWQLGARGVHSWRLNRVEDPYGNGYDIEYVDPDSPQPLAQRIRYHNVVVEFEYIPRPFPKTFVYHGKQFSSDKLLKGIHVSVAGQTYRRYQFGYELAQSLKAVRLNEVIECGADGTCLVPTTFEYEQPQASGFGFENKAHTLGQQGGICADGKHASAHRYGKCDSPAGDGKRKGYDYDGTGNHGSIQYADANGDGHMDICFRSDQTGVRCQLNDGQNHFNENHYIASNAGVCDDYGSHKSEQCDNPDNFGTIAFIDFNKDGKADLVFRGDTWGVTFIPNINGVFDVNKRFHEGLCDNGRLCDDANNYFSIRYLNLNCRAPRFCRSFYQIIG